MCFVVTIATSVRQEAPMRPPQRRCGGSVPIQASRDHIFGPDTHHRTTQDRHFGYSIAKINYSSGGLWLLDSLTLYLPA
jgi:hypothetical protein